MPRQKSKFAIVVKHYLKFRYHSTLRETYRLQKFNEYGMIFIHIPKAAGTAINTGLFGRLAGLGHMSCQKYLQIYGASRFQAMFKFTFVRNPYDRFVSAYEYLKSGGNNSYDLGFCENTMSQFKDFDDFVLNGFSRDKRIQNHVHFRKQTDFLLINDRLAVDFLGHFENIENDYRYIASMIESAQPLATQNASDRSKKLDAYFCNNAVKKVVADFYEPDFRILNYHP